MGGRSRQQIFMLNLTTKQATVTGWTSSQFDGSRASGHHYPYQWFWTESFYLRSAAWSPDDSRIYTGSV